MTTPHEQQIVVERSLMKAAAAMVDEGMSADAIATACLATAIKLALAASHDADMVQGWLKRTADELPAKLQTAHRPN